MVVLDSQFRVFVQKYTYCRSPIMFLFNYLLFSLTTGGDIPRALDLCFRAGEDPSYANNTLVYDMLNTIAQVCLLFVLLFVIFLVLLRSIGFSVANLYPL